MERTINLLLVDDHQIVLDGLKSMLVSNPRFQVKDTALSGEEAWTKISVDKIPVDVVITDISMSGMSGTDLCRKIKDYKPRLKVMILSMHQEVNYVKEALACEADGYILKNSGRNDLVHALETLISRGSYYAHEIVPLLYGEMNGRKLTSDSIRLSPRELEILQLILKEHTSKEIAEQLFISKQTVDSHRINILEKTGSKSVVGLIKYAIQHNLIQL